MMHVKTGTRSIDVRSKRRPTISVLMVKGEECPTPCLSKLLSVEAGSLKTSVKFLVMNAWRQIYSLNVPLHIYMGEGRGSSAWACGCCCRMCWSIELSTSCKAFTTRNLTLVLTLPASTESSLDKQGVGHSSPLTIKTEMVGLRFERTSMLLVPVLTCIIERCQRPC